MIHPPQTSSFTTTMMSRDE